MRSLSAVKALLLAIAAISSSCVFAQSSQPSQSQSAPPAAPAFDVAAIHQYIPEPHERSHIVNSSGRFITSNVDLKSIIQWAYDLPQSRIVGGPSWIGSARWDIEAKADNALDIQKNYDLAAAQLEKQRMVQALLADRFHLMAHQETRELPVYNLIVAKSGAKFLDTKAEGSKFDRWNNRIELQGGDNTVAVLAEQLAEVLGRVVVDKTGIHGRYKIMLKWAPDDRADASSSSADSGPSIFTALEEQLGLKIESAKGPVSVLVIDRAEMPSEN